ncbi:hypothetical protein P280DRAFT_532831 [Massarina eburnea CBS 473.64]|uniref:Uncharacterized protein n=1 Tax=Massarina eburnea CBS 473.64 TaxID=1395130 RepID=A0A6A6RRV6_9PLEO|nr:hypothetical protein P280DRAFT_532831 [Massarina eburnea CBS 473.64]
MKPFQKHSGHTRLVKILLWVSLSINILFLGLVFFCWVVKKQNIRSSYESGFISDLESVKAKIAVTQYQFTGGVELDESGQFFMDHSMQQYVGTPTPEIDRAWHKLLTGLNIDLDPSEANLGGRTFQWPDSGLYFTGLEVYHSLHCLNRLRQALYPDYYDVFSNPDDPKREDHIGHCINHIRQAIQCHADLTPMEWKQSGNSVILNTATQHTCRDFSKVHEWAMQRRTKFEDIQSVKNGSLFVVD